jgi:site-specific recombinase XerD
MFKDQITRYKVVYNRKKETDKKDGFLVQIEVYQNGRRRFFSTGIYLTQEQWNIKKNEPKDAYTAARVRSFVAVLEEHEKKQRYFHDGRFALKDFDLLKVVATPPPAKPTFNQFFASQLKARKKELKWNTYRQQTACLNLLNEFNPSVLFEDLKFQFVDEFHQFMINKGHKDTTYHKRHKIVKSYIQKAISLELLTKNAYDQFKLTTPISNKVALMGDEIKLLENLNLNEQAGRMSIVRDMFLLSIYTGLRWGDISVLTAHNLIRTENGIVLNIVTSKTQKALVLPLRIMFDGKAEQIVLRYWPDNDEKKLFSGIYNAFANKTLKAIAKLAGIKKKIHYHVSRHTAGTAIAQKAGVLTAMEILQHSKLETTKIYLHLSNFERDKALKDVKDWY